MKVYLALSIFPGIFQPYTRWHATVVKPIYNILEPRVYNSVYITFSNSWKTVW